MPLIDLTGEMPSRLGLGGTKIRGLSVCLATTLTLLRLCRPVEAADPYRALEIAELSRTVDAATIADLDAEPALAARAALALGRTKRRDAAAPALRAHLVARDPGLRAMAAYGLGLLDDATARPDLRTLATADPSSAVRYAALDALGRIVAAGAPGTAERSDADVVLAAASGDRDPLVRAHAAAQLDAFAKVPYARDVVRALERCVDRDRDPDVRWHAMWAIYRGFATEADDAFVRAAAVDRDELVRVEAVRAWGRRPDADVAALAGIAANDASWRVQLEAREALHRARHEPPTEHLASVPPDVRLPPLPPIASPPAPVATTAPRRDVATAPDPATLALAPFPRIASAADLARPARGPHPRLLMTTTRGDVVIALDPAWAPSTVANFLSLAARGYFDGNRWFRIVPDFVVQSGDPHDDENGTSPFVIPAEENPREQRSYVLAMGLDYKADAPLRDSAGSQFYFTLSPQLHLDRAFSVFGSVERGEDVLANLVERDRILRVVRLPDR